MNPQQHSVTDSAMRLVDARSNTTAVRGERHMSISPLSAVAPSMDAAADDADERYGHELGERLRRVRRARGLRLQDVEERSGGRFKAVVIGSYERGDRGMSAQRLANLAAFYSVPIAELLPDEPLPPPREKPGLCLAVDRLRASGDDPSTIPLRRLVEHIQWLRGDYNGRYLSLRDDDLQTAAVALGLDPQDLGDWLGSRGLLAD